MGACRVQWPAAAYPWGDIWHSERAVTIDAGFGKEQPVGTYPLGANRWGVQDLIGNVWEWTSSKASVYEGNSMQLPARYKDLIVARGGGYGSRVHKVSAAARDWFAPDYKNRLIGFLWWMRQVPNE
jgi:iron(II)-dependent oxidoreductase